MTPDSAAWALIGYLIGVVQCVGLAALLLFLLLHRRPKPLTRAEREVRAIVRGAWR